MAVRGAVRFKPDVYRSSLETTVSGLKPDATPPEGTVYMVAQLVAYDDTVVTGGNYVAGDPATERNITILYEETLGKELASFNALTQPQATAAWTTSLDQFRIRVEPAAANLLKAIRGARRTNPVLMS